MLLVSFSTPLGVLIGRIVQESCEGPYSAGLICFAAGSLFSVAVYDMLLPSLLSGGTHWQRRSFVASLLGFCAMSLLAIWS